MTINDPFPGPAGVQVHSATTCPTGFRNAQGLERKVSSQPSCGCTGPRLANFTAASGAPAPNPGATLTEAIVFSPRLFRVKHDQFETFSTLTPATAAGSIARRAFTTTVICSRMSVSSMAFKSGMATLAAGPIIPST